MQQSSSQKQTNTKPLSSLPLQTLIYFDNIFSIVFFLLELVIFVYKNYGLYYPSQTISVEVTMVFLFGFWQFARLHIGSIGNKTESSDSILWFLILTLPSTFGFVFYLRLQTYVLLVEYMLNALGLVFVTLEFFIALVALKSFKSFERNE